jgi:SAM-dependent methyltransferase
MNRHGNRQKHLNPNPLQRALLDRFHQKVAELVRQTGATCLLDAGCGEGFVLKYLQEQHLPLSGVMGGDSSAEALVWGRANLQHNAPLTRMDIHHLPFPGNSFPLVICLEVLEHLPDSTVGLRELARVSSDYVLLSVPHEPFFRGANFLRGKHVLAFGNDPEHFHNYSGRSFRRMVSSVVDIVWHGYAFPWQVALGRKRY